MKSLKQLLFFVVLHSFSSIAMEKTECDSDEETIEDPKKDERITQLNFELTNDCINAISNLLGDKFKPIQHDNYNTLNEKINGNLVVLYNNLKTISEQLATHNQRKEDSQPTNSNPKKKEKAVCERNDKSFKRLVTHPSKRSVPERRGKGDIC